MDHKWNLKPQQLLHAGRPAPPRLSLKVQFAGYALAMLTAVWTGSHSSFWLAWMGLTAYGSILQPAFFWLGRAVTAYIAVLTLDMLWAAADRKRPRKWEQKLGPKQLRLLGLDVAVPQQQQPQQQQQQQQQQAGGGQPRPQLLMPQRQQRGGGPPASPGLDLRGSGTPAAMLPGGADRSPSPGPMSFAGRRSLSPYSSSPVVTTPEQLQRYLDTLDAQSAPATPQETAYVPLGHADGGQDSHGAAPLAGQGSFSLRGATPEGLKQGVEAPTYRPSILPSRAAGLAPSPDGRLRPSTAAAVKEIMHQLVTDQRTLEVWTERLREWLSTQVVRPLVQDVESFHEEVIGCAAKLGLAGLQLAPLSVDTDAEDKGRRRGSRGGAGAQADADVIAAQLREQLASRLRSAPQQGPPEAWACLEAVNKYQRLAAVLRGEHPRGMLPPAPRGYVATRLRQLADGSCLNSFTWNGGGSWQGQPWTPDLPTDSALIFYIFAAYLEAPRWQFAMDESVSHLSNGGPLFVGSLPARQPDAYYALLPVRVPKMAKGAMAVLGIGLGTQEPHFTLVLNGEPLLTLSDTSAVFRSLLLWLQAAKTAGGGLIGGRSLEYLKLAAVLRPADRNFDLFRGKWFGIWS